MFFVLSYHLSFFDIIYCCRNSFFINIFIIIIVDIIFAAVLVCYMIFSLLLYFSMVSLMLIVVGYYLANIVLNYIFSLSLCGFISLISVNFECGFLSSLSTFIRFRFNYWLIIINFLLFELELLISFLYICTLISFSVYIIFFIFMLLLFFDLFYD